MFQFCRGYAIPRCRFEPTSVEGERTDMCAVCLYVWQRSGPHIGGSR